MTTDNCTEFVDGLFNDALSITNDAMKYFEVDDRGHLAFTASLLSEIFFMLGMASTDMEFSFSSANKVGQKKQALIPYEVRSTLVFLSYFL